MKGLTKGCLESLVIWGIGAGLLFYWFSGHFEPPGELWGAIGGGFLISCAWGMVRNIISARSRIALLERTKRGTFPEDGKLYAIAGKVSPISKPLISPFFQKECVVFGYSVYREYSVTTGTGSNRQTQQNKSTYMGGFALCPSIVRSPVVNLKLLGFAIPDTFPEEKIAAPEVREQVLKYIEEHKVPVEKGIMLRQMFSQVGQVLSEDDGEHRYDWRGPDLEDILQMGDAVCSEQCIPVSASIVAIGTYDAKRGGLISNLSDGGMEVFQGSIDDAIKSIGAKSITQLIVAVILSLLGTFGAYGILTARELRDTDLIRKKQNQLNEAIQRDDRAKISELLKRGTALDSVEIKQTIREVSSPELLNLLVQSGFDINSYDHYGQTVLLSAVRSGELERVRMLLESGADVNMIQKDWRTTPLELAFDHRFDDIFELLRSRGAKGIFVKRGEGAGISGGVDGPLAVIKSYLTAKRNGDIEGIRSVVDDWPEDFFSSVERGYYRDVGLIEPVLIWGATQGDVTTVLVTNPPEYRKEQWLYTLVRKGNEWKILRESWDEFERWGH